MRRFLIFACGAAFTLALTFAASSQIAPSAGKGGKAGGFDAPMQDGGARSNPSRPPHHGGGSWEPIKPMEPAGPRPQGGKPPEDWQDHGPESSEPISRAKTRAQRVSTCNRDNDDRWSNCNDMCIQLATPIPGSKSGYSVRAYENCLANCNAEREAGRRACSRIK